MAKIVAGGYSPATNPYGQGGFYSLASFPGSNSVAGPNSLYGKTQLMLAKAQNQANAKKKEATTKTTSALDNLSNYGNYISTIGGSYSASGVRPYEVAKADISGLLEAYEKQAETSRANAETKYKNTRNDLLTSLKRFQEQNAMDVKNQKQNYLAEQANLESARESANRQSRISAAARGLGGSGLQQLAQLQNLLGQSEEISLAAGKNQTAMDKLATLLREYEEDSNTKMKQNEEERTSTLNSIASQLASQKAAAIAQNEEAYTNALNAMRAATSQYSYSSSPGTRVDTGALVRTVLSSLDDDIKNAKNETAARSQTKIAEKTIQQILEAYGNPNNVYGTYRNDVNKLMKSYGYDNYYR